MCVYIYIYIYTYTFVGGISVCVCVCVYTHTHTHTHINATNKCTPTLKFVHIYTDVNYTYKMELQKYKTYHNQCKGANINTTASSSKSTNM